MKTFDQNKFSKDLIKLRKETTKKILADKLNVSVSLLSILENKRQIPSKDIFTKICELGNFKPDNYFVEIESNLDSLTRNLEEKDKEKIIKMISRVKIKEKYNKLSKA